MENQQDISVKAQSFYASLTKIQRLTFGGFLLVLIANIFPIFSISSKFLGMSETTNVYFGSGEYSFGFWYWVIVGLCAGATFFCYKKDYVKTFFLAAVAGIVGLLTYVFNYLQMQGEVGKYSDFISVGFGFGFIILALGIALILFANFAYAKDALAFAKKLSNDAVAKAKTVASTPPAKEGTPQT